MINLNRRAINVALKSIAGSRHSQKNIGLHHVRLRTICPYNTNKEARDVNYLYRYVSAKPSFPTLSSDVEDIIARPVGLVEERNIFSRLSKKITTTMKGENKLPEKRRKHSWKNKTKNQKGRTGMIEQIYVFI